MTEVEKYLYGYSNLARMKKSMENDLADAIGEYHCQADKMLNPRIMSDVNSGRTNKINDPVQDIVIRLVDTLKVKVDRLMSEIDILSLEQDEIFATIKRAKLTHLEESYIKLRYLKGYRSWQAAQRLQYSERQTKRFRVSALAKISSVLNDGL